MEEITQSKDVDKAIQYFGNIFDKTIDKEPENEKQFKELVLTKGTKIIYTLTKFINYDEHKSKILYNMAFKICMLAIFEGTASPKPLEIAFGCRSPTSKGSGYWDGAYIIIKNKDEMIKAFTFDNSKDAIIEYDNIKDAFKIYKQYLKNKWIKMDTDDIKKTVGIEITANTLIEYNDIRRIPSSKIAISLLLTIPLFIGLRKILRMKNR